MIGSGDMKSNLDLRYGLGVVDAYDARDIFSDGKLSASLLALGDDDAYRGVFLMQAPGRRRVMPVKGYWIDPDTIPGIAQRNSQYRAKLDAETANAVHEYLEQMGVSGGYYGRWNRTLQALGVEQVERPRDTVPERPTGTPTAEQQPVKQDSPAAQKVRDAVAKHRSDQDKQRFEELVRNSGWDSETGQFVEQSGVPEQATVPPILRLTLAAFDARNAEQLPTKVIVSDLPGTPTEHTLGRLMRLCQVSGTEVIWDGKRRRGYTRDAIETAIKTSSWQPGAFSWEP
jgi:hypothetical protein